MSAERVLVVPQGLCLRLRSISESDLENLRVWKNQFRHRFFHKSVIASHEQSAWYEGFRTRPEDFMYIVEATCVSPIESFGCLGFRVIEDVVDVYNVIRSRQIEGQGCSMGDALRLLCSHAARRGKPVTCKVLKDNPAISWYEEHGFTRTEEKPEYYLMQWNAERFALIPHVVEELR